MTKKIFVNLPITDLNRAVAFYEAIGGTKNEQFSNEQAAAIVLSDSIYVMLLTNDFYRTFTAKPIIDAHAMSGVLLALSCDSKADVDAMVEKAVAAGGKGDPGPKQDFGFMYGRSFEDPDGHHWEPHWMDLAAAPPNPAALAEA
ncbi:lactoylglutathione lyase [Sphingomonas sp. HDW15A]|uniref:VOC family protein n=1 Tax=Sphingomonas sp. HDW15A TaxID=2714942 RepID=UPI001408576A|nr:VOC family protein [Sphingomonas sp. HDW15A]QIK96817.1 lactoylglutathione lyase [Sphingomonas sp. HDW15A]